MSLPTWWMAWQEDGQNPIAYYQAKYGASPTHIKTPLDYPAAAIQKLEAAGYTVIPSRDVCPGMLFLGRTKPKETE